MAIISSYPTITPTSSDLVLVVDTSEDGNPTKTATVGSLQSVVRQVQKVITSAELLSFNTYPTSIELIPNPGPNKAIVGLNVAFKLQNPAGTAYNFNQDLRFSYVNPLTGGVTSTDLIPLELLNSPNTPIHTTQDLPGALGSPLNIIKVDNYFGLTNNGGTTVTQGTGELVVDLIYRIVEFPL